MDKQTLKPCPFCGSAAQLTEVEPSGYVVECTRGTCNASTNIRYSCGDDARPLVAEQWNRRDALPEAGGGPGEKSLREVMAMSEDADADTVMANASVRIRRLSTPAAPEAEALPDTLAGAAADRAREPGDGTQEGNARLIASAPELLKELQHLAALLHPWIEAGNTVPGIATLNGAWAAIAKATGES